MAVIVRYECGHVHTFRLLKPAPSCPECRTLAASEFMRARVEASKGRYAALRATERAENAHAYGRSHDEAVCGVCRVKSDPTPPEQGWTGGFED